MSETPRTNAARKTWREDRDVEELFFSFEKVETELTALQSAQFEICQAMRRKDKSLPTIAEIRDRISQLHTENDAMKVELEKMTAKARSRENELDDARIEFRNRLAAVTKDLKEANDVIALNHAALQETVKERDEFRKELKELMAALTLDYNATVARMVNMNEVRRAIALREAIKKLSLPSSGAWASFTEEEKEAYNSAIGMERQPE